MSSDGSVSSRISQFGLYRTIDARTEEFLKLSKKRQIKQGCVCAAISTALTVTIVVTVLLIYEYNVIAEARRSNHKSTWLGLMNNSADDQNLLEILNKEKVDIDKTTLKLLPILLKALNQNVFTEKTIEEPTSFYTPYKKEITTETDITKNIFADTRNWMKTPHSRLYTIEYKTSPLVYSKNPTRNIEYFTKIRKIRDYQRILNYVDKMISDKNSLGTTQPMRRDYDHTEKPYKMTTPIRKHKPTQKVVKKQIASPKTTNEENNRNCKCSHKLGEIINKLLNSIKQLLSYFSGSNLNETIRCNNTPIQKEPTKHFKEKPIIRNIHKMITENYNVFEPKLTKAPSYKTFLNRHKYIIDPPTKKIDMRRDHTVNAIMNLIKPNFNKRIENEMNLESNEAFSTTNSYVKSSDINDILRESSSKSYFKPMDNTNSKVSADIATTVTDYIVQKRMYDIAPDVRSSLSNYPENDFSEENDYTETTETTTIVANNFNRLNTYNLLKIRSNVESGRKNVSNGDKSYSFKGARSNQNLMNTIGSMRKMGNLVSKDKGNSLFLPDQHRFAPILKQNSKLTTTRTKLNSNYKKNITNTIKPTEKTTIKNIIIIKNTEAKVTNFKQNSTNNITTEEKTERVSDENLSQETTLKNIEEAIMILNNETSTNQTDDYNKISPDTYQWEMVKVDENDASKKFMIPLGRSTYLEMQRNDWKHDENHDFDNDMNYIFD